MDHPFSPSLRYPPLPHERYVPAEEKVVQGDRIGRTGSRSLLPNLCSKEICYKKEAVWEGLLFL